jgi:hypothetical protein
MIDEQKSWERYGPLVQALSSITLRTAIACRGKRGAGRLGTPSFTHHEGFSRSCLCGLL